MAKPVLAVQNIHCETLGTMEDLLLADGFDVRVLDGRTESLPDDPSMYSMVIVLGGPMAVYDGLAFLNQEMQLIRNAIAKDVPLLGVCLGSQLIAQAAGGTVYPSGAKEIGWYSVNIGQAGKEGLLAGLEEPLSVFQWHGDTYELPASAQVLAYSDLYPQAFRIGSAFGVQFHLEVNEPLIRSWIDQYASEIASEKLDPKKIAGDPLSIVRLSASCKRLYRNFVKISAIA